MLNQYELVVIFTPILSEEELNKEIKIYTDYIRNKKGEIVNEERWGLRQMAYPIQKKTTGIYLLLEFKMESTLIGRMETLMGRDEKIIRELITKLDKDAIVYNVGRRARLAEEAKGKTKDKSNTKVKEEEA